MKKDLIVIALSGLYLLLNAQVPLETTPFWISEVSSSTRDIVLGDIDCDGDLDLVVATEVGEDAIHVYFNWGSGLETYPSLIFPINGAFSVALGDVNNDGYLDLAVAYSAFAGSSVRLYLNTDGAIDTIPDWVGSTGGLWIGWCDVDNDGDLDLAAVDILSNPASVYLNNDGTLEPTPSWQATDGYQWDIAGTWFDADADGDLDLVVGYDPYRIYFNENGSLETVASWHPDAPLSGSGSGFAAGDINHDNLLDLSVAGGGVGVEPNFLHVNSGSGLETTPSWTSVDLSNTWRMAFGDINNDGYLDLAAANGEQSGDVIYLNMGGTIDPSPSWISDFDSYSIGIALADIDNDGVINRTDTLTGDGVGKLFYLSHFPAHIFEGVTVGGSPVPLSDYCFDPVAGWVSLKDVPANASEILLNYSYSIDLELVAGSLSPAAYRNTTIGIEETPSFSASDLLFRVAPTIIKRGSKIAFTLNKSGKTVLSIYDLLGREIVCKNMGEIPAGRHTFSKTELQSGVYFLSVSLDGDRQIEKILICE